MILCRSMQACLLSQIVTLPEVRFTLISDGASLCLDVADDDEDEGGEEEAEAPKAVHAPQHLELAMTNEMRDAVKAQWEQLRDSVDALRPIERFEVVGVSYRRQALHHHLDGGGPSQCFQACGTKACPLHSILRQEFLDPAFPGGDLIPCRCGDT